MNKWLLTVWLACVVTALTGNTQEQDASQKIPTSTDIYDVESRDDIHRFSTREIRELIKMENGRHQGAGTVPHPVLVGCFEERIFRYTGGKYQDAEIKYRLHTPKTIRSGHKYPLVVHLHGWGEAGSDNTSSLIHLHSILPVMIGPKQQDFFMLVVQCPQETPNWYFQSTKDGTFDVLMAVMEHVIAENPIDPKRMTVTGVSSGGWGVWSLISRYPDMFAGAVPTACGVPHHQQRYTTPIWLFTNKEDFQVPPSETIREAVRVVNNSGGSMVFSETHALGHNAWGPAMEHYDCLQWMLAQKKGGWFSPPPGTIVHKPYSLLLILVMHILPLSVVILLTWDTIYEWVSIASQSVWEWVDRGR